MHVYSAHFDNFNDLWHFCFHKLLVVWLHKLDICELGCFDHITEFANTYNFDLFTYPFKVSFIFEILPNICKYNNINVDHGAKTKIERNKCIHPWPLYWL